MWKLGVQTLFFHQLPISMSLFKLFLDLEGFVLFAPQWRLLFHFRSPCPRRLLIFQFSQADLPISTLFPKLGGARLLPVLQTLHDFLDPGLQLDLREHVADVHSNHRVVLLPKGKAIMQCVKKKLKKEKCCTPAACAKADHVNSKNQQEQHAFAILRRGHFCLSSDLPVSGSFS